MAFNIWEYILPSLFGGKPSSETIANSMGSDRLISSLQSGDRSAEDVLAEVAKGGYRLSPEQESYLSAMLSNQRTNEARDYETMMANTDFTRAAEQLGALGMSPYNVLQSGASATPNVSAAASPMLNNANQRYNRAASIAGSLIGMAGRMASSGIYGSALSSVRGSAAKAASIAAHSAPMMLSPEYRNDYNFSDDEVNALLKEFEGR